jgi:hypothetical protein
VLTSKDKIIKIMIDHSGNLFHSDTEYKIPRKEYADKEN